MSLSLILRCRAATYLRTSLTVMSDAEYHSYLTQFINFHYPNLKTWHDAYQYHLDQDIPLVEVLIRILDKFPDTDPEITNAFLTNLTNSCEQIYNLYRALSFQIDQETGDYVAPPNGVDLYEWWLGTPTGMKSCSRDIGELRSEFNVGKGDEWGMDLEAAILQYQIDHAPYIVVPTGYACAETLRRLRMNA